ncbi:MAG: hypothetical protein M1817_005196 [Caeruleum heppii]|nr:MAG: hypothetical protein M1817_005196 [Caeruleum heppii]
MSAVNSGDFDLERIIPLLDAVRINQSDEVIWNKVYAAVTEFTPPPGPLPLLKQTPYSYNTSGIVDSSENRMYMDEVLKAELGPLYTGVPGFYEAFFGEVKGLEAAGTAVFKKCKEGDNPLYSDEGGWRDWPQSAMEKEVLKWFVERIELFMDFAKEHGSAPKTQRRPLAQPHQSLQGSTAERKLDVGFINVPKASGTTKYHWSQILVPGELKSNPGLDTLSRAWLDLGRYAREVLAAQDTRRFVLGFTLCGSVMRLWEFDRLGGIASATFNIHKDGLQFVSVVLGYLWMNEEQLGFDPTMLASDGKRYIEIVRNDQTERLVLDGLIKRAPCVVGRATTCWKAHREGDESKMPLVIKDSWQYPEREEEGELLREATDKGVINVARYYHHETVRVGGKDDNIRDNVRKGLDIARGNKYEPEGSMMPPSTSDVPSATRRDPNTSIGSTRRKRSSSRTNTPLPPSKRACSSSATIGGGGPATRDRVHRRVIVRDYGKAIYKASSRAAMLAALAGCIAGYESLHRRAGMLQCDISKGNLLMNEEDDNPSWQSFLIDLDLAIKEQREGPSGARSKTGTRAFMAIGVLYGDEEHSCRHDLESFFWVLFWICIHHNGPNEVSRVVPRFEKWNFIDTTELAASKYGAVSDERDFLRTAGQNFTAYYRPLIPWVNRLRKVVFPGDKRRREEDEHLGSHMQEVLRNAREDSKVSGR